MRITLRFLLWLTGIVLALALGTLFVLPKVLDLTGQIPLLLQTIERETGRKASVSRLALDLSGGLGFKGRDFILFEAGGKGEAIRADSATFVIKLLPFLLDRGRIELAGIRLEAPFLEIHRRGEATNFDDIFERFGGREESAGDAQTALQKALKASPIQFLRIEEGKILYIDEFPKTAEGTQPPHGANIIELSNLSLSVQGLRPLTPIEISVSSSLQTGASRTGTFDIEGSVTFRSEDFDPQNSQLAFRGRLAEIDLGWLERMGWWPHTGLERGIVSGEFSAVGNPLKHFLIEGALDGKQVRGHWPELWVTPLEPATVRFPFEFERQGNTYEVRIHRGDLNGMGLRLVRLSFAFAGGEPGFRFAMDLDLDNVRWEKHFEYFPWNRLPHDLSATLRERLEHLGGASRVIVNQQARFDGNEAHTDWDHFRAEGDFLGMTMRVGRGSGGPELTDITGKFRFQHSAVSFEGMRANVDALVPLRFDGGFPKPFEEPFLELDLDGTVPLSALARVVPRYAFPGFRNAIAPLRKASGSAEADAHMEMHLGTGDFRYEGELGLLGVDIPFEAAGLDLRGVKGTLSFSHESLETSLLTGTCGNSPVRLSLTVSRPQSENPSVEGSFEGENLFLEPIVRAWAGDMGYGAQGLVSLRNLRLQYDPSVGGPVKVQGSVHVKGATLTAPFLRHPVEELNCVFLLDASGRDDLGCQGVYNTSDLRVEGVADRAGGKPGARLDVKSLYLDVADLLASVDPTRLPATAALPPSKEEPSGEEPSPPALSFNFVTPLELLRDGEMEINVSASSFRYDRLTGRNLISTMRAVPDSLSFQTLVFEGPGGQYRIDNGLLERRREGIWGIALEPNLTGVDIPPLLDVLNFPSQSVEGRLDLQGSISFEGTNREERIQSALGQIKLRAYGGRIVDVKKVQVLARILTALQWKQDKYEGGVPFNEISGEFKIRGGVAKTNELLFDSPKFSIRTRGDINFATQKMSMIALVKIGQPVDFALNQIPLLRMFTDKRVSLLAIPVPISGSWQDPTVRIEEGEPPPAMPE